MKGARGWYIKRGRYGMRFLQGEPAIVWIKGGQLYAQFDNTELPHQFTYGKVPMHQSVLVLEVETTGNKITLEHLGKRYRRTVRNGFFDFHGVECKAWKSTT